MLTFRFSNDPVFFFSQCPQQSTFSVSLRRILLKFLLDDKIVDGSMEEGQFEMVSTFFIFLFFIFFSVRRHKNVTIFFLQDFQVTESFQNSISE